MRRAMFAPILPRPTTPISMRASVGSFYNRVGERRFQKMKRSFLCAMLLLALPALAQNYPSKPIRIIVPFGAGSATDLISRVIGASVSTAVGQPVIVDNKAGA